MSKRKSAAPRRADEQKRQCLSWNMMDVGAASLVAPGNSEQTMTQDQQVALLPAMANASPGGSTSTTSGVCHTEAAGSPMQLQDFLSSCQFFLPIVCPSSVEATHEWTCQLGTFDVRLHSRDACSMTDVLENVSEFWLYVSHLLGKSMLYFELPENRELWEVLGVSSSVIYFAADIEFPYGCLEALRTKVFKLKISKYDHDSKLIQISINLLEGGLVVPVFASEGARPKKVNLAVQQITAQLNNFFIPDYSNKTKTKKQDIEQFYEVIRSKHEVIRCKHEVMQSGLQQSMADGATGTVQVQHPSLLPVLRPYQRSAVQWMLSREQQHCDNNLDIAPSHGDANHSLWEEFTSGCGKKLYYNKFSGSFTKQKQGFIVSPPGGILADEMGLGKTIEVLACMLLHPRPKTDLIMTVQSMLSQPSSVVQDQIYVRMDKTRQSDITHPSDVNPKEKVHVETGISVEHHYVECKESVPDKITVNAEEMKCHDGGNTKANKQLVNINMNNDDESDVTEEVIGHNSDTLLSYGNQGDDLVKLQQNLPVGDVMSNGSKDENLLSNEKDLANSEEKNEAGHEKKRSHHKQSFGCICGTRDITEDKLTVECEKCRIVQHPQCVNFDPSLLGTRPYLCPHCLVASTPAPSGATLIISPNSICHQWVEEISKHVRQQRLKVFVYTGVTKQGFVQPSTLGDHDIVITTYETLRKEIDYVDLPHTNSEGGRKFRHPKRFMAVPSPIIAVEWWRICLDEAQMVECTTTKTAEMALRLTAVNRWCVTGTPIQKSMDDLYGLILFLRLDPFWVRHWWTKLLFEPYCHDNQRDLINVVAKVLWRTSKKDVIDQINLPAQQELIHRLHFSPVEEHFYSRQYKDCISQSMKKLSKWTESDMKLNSLDRQTLHQLLYPLTRLRQACCHPQAVRGEFLPINKSTMTMEELLKSLTKKVRVESEESHRQVVAALNAQAGILVIQAKFSEAVDRYRAALQSIEEHKDRVRTDDLQLLHTLCNLDEVLQAKHENIAPTLRDDHLKKQAAELKDKYLAKAAAYVTSSQESLIPAQKNVRQLHKEFKNGHGWWAELITWVDCINMAQELTMKMKDELSEHSRHGYNSISRRFTDLRGLELILSLQLDQLQASRESIVASLRSISSDPTRSIINQTVECCLRPIGEASKTCPFCKVDDSFRDYESRLYLFIEKGTNASTNEDDTFHYLTSSRRQGTWADSEAEKSLKILMSFCRNMGGDRELIEFGNLHMKIFEALKKEFKCLRTVFIALKEQVSSFDELDMATMRFRLRLSDEPMTEPPLPYILEEAELGQFQMKQQSDEVIGRRDLQRKLGQLLYLTNLAKAEDIQQSGMNPEPCPICQRELGEEWSVLQCGHCFCLDCIRIMVDEYSFGGHHKSLRCAVCRQRNLHADISYVSTKRKKESEVADEIKVKGDHSTKVDGVIRCLLKIQQTDPGSKALVFSTWQDVLDIIAQALEQNGIQFRSLHSQNKYQKNLTAFKHNDDITVLLLPVHSGGNGLNLIEATHVLLVEPILNTAQELQVVGRVHRIGQTKPTMVHRFLVHGTIEQRMHELLQTVQTPTNSQSMEDTQLTIGHLTALFQEADTDADIEASREQEGAGEAESTATADSNARREETEGGSEIESTATVENNAGMDAAEGRCGIRGTANIDSNARGGKAEEVSDLERTLTTDINTARSEAEGRSGIESTATIEDIAWKKEVEGVSGKENTTAAENLSRPSTSDEDAATQNHQLSRLSDQENSPQIHTLPTPSDVSTTLPMFSSHVRCAQNITHPHHQDEVMPTVTQCPMPVSDDGNKTDVSHPDISTSIDCNVTPLNHSQTNIQAADDENMSNETDH